MVRQDPVRHRLPGDAGRLCRHHGRLGRRLRVEFPRRGPRHRHPAAGDQAARSGPDRLLTTGRSPETDIAAALTRVVRRWGVECPRAVGAREREAAMRSLVSTITVLKVILATGAEAADLLSRDSADRDAGYSGGRGLLTYFGQKIGRAHV